MLNQNDWFCWHIYYHDNLNNIITKCLPDIVNYLKIKDINFEWFYIRYWSGGPHIRFRVKLTHNEYIKDIEEKLFKFLRENPSVNAIEKDVIEQQQGKLSFLEDASVVSVHENNSIIKSIYEPEYEKYGDEKSIYISENHFMYSSESSMELLKKYSKKGQVMMFAIEYLIMYLKELNLDVKSMIVFLDNYSKIWADYLRVDIEKLDKIFGEKQQKQENITDYIERYMKYEENIIPDSIYEKWNRNIKNTFISLKDRYGEVSYNNSEVVSIVLNYMHVHNNRLGIIPLEEIYLAKLTQSGLEKAKI